MSALPRVVLLGDSIRMGYQPAVAANLSRRADVWGPENNCRWAAYLLDHLAAWAVDTKPDVVVANAGLHDVVVPEAGGTIRTRPNEYARNVGDILHRLTAETSAAVIWAMTTPVIDARVLARHGRQHRTNADVERYNAIALDVARSAGVAICRLDTLVATLGPERLLLPDGVHFTPEGYARLAGAVAESVLAALGNRATV